MVASASVATTSVLMAASLLELHLAVFVQSAASKLAPGYAEPQALEIPTLVSVASSEVCEGRGLFASEGMSAGSLVSLYPIHGVGVDQASGRVDLVASAEDMECFEGDKSEYRLYLRHAGLGGTCIEANPNRACMDGWTAHLVNDAASCASRSPQDVESYLEASVSRANCALVPLSKPPLMACVTTREVCARARPCVW